MDAGCATFSLTEIEELLSLEGLRRDSPEFMTERRRRFRPVESIPDIFVEREDWPGKPPHRFDVC